MCRFIGSIVLNILLNSPGAVVVVTATNVDVYLYMVRKCEGIPDGSQLFFRQSVDDCNVVSVKRTSSRLGAQKCSVLAFLYVLAGSQVTPYISHIGPQKMLNKLFASDELIQNALLMIDGAGDISMHHVKQVASNFYATVEDHLIRSSSVSSLAELSYTNHLARSDKVDKKLLISHIPPTKSIINNHVKRCLFVFAMLYVDSVSHVNDVEQYGFVLKNDFYIPQWY